MASHGLSVAAAALILVGSSLLLISQWAARPTALYAGAVGVSTTTRSSRPPSQLYGKGRGGGRRAQMQQMNRQTAKPPTPPLDPDNEEFVLFIRAKDVGTKWLPLTVVTGGSSANNLVKATQGSLATDVFKNQLIRSIGEVVYRDQAKVEKMIRSSKVPGLGAVKEFEYGFKVRDKKDPEAWMDDTDVTLIPPKDRLPTTPLNTIAEGVRGLADKLGFGPKPAGAPGAK